jgi:hypothetical protein
VGDGDGEAEGEVVASPVLAVSPIVCWPAVESEQPLLRKNAMPAMVAATAAKTVDVDFGRSIFAERNRTQIFAVLLEKSVMNNVIPMPVSFYE